VSEAHPGTKSNIGVDILHALRVKRRLELSGHEAIAFSRVYQAEKMNVEHSDVESNGDDNETEKASKEVLEPQALFPLCQ
jgi:hypothetical protein